MGDAEQVEIYSYFFGSMGATTAMVFSALGAAYGTGEYLVTSSSGCVGFVLIAALF